jgi:glycerol-3-phosphate dehydrogenase (NAD(P)+)
MAKTIGIVGGGAWGIALASVLGNTVLLTRTAEQAKDLSTTRKTDRLPGCTIPDSVEITSDLMALQTVDILLMVCPVNDTRTVLQTLRIPEQTPILHCAKGLEQKTKMLMTQVGQDILPHNLHGVLSGPGFARDVVSGKPIAITLACTEIATAQDLQAELYRPTFRPYVTTDIIGVQLGGTLKNVIAIAAGICMGQKLGESARASLIARGFSEMQRLGIAMGGNPETFTGLSGLGDLVLTCSSAQSRNFAYGLAIGTGEIPDPTKLAEGTKSAQVILELAQQYNLDVPICEAVAHILDGSFSIQQVVDRLLQRPLKQE